MIKTIFYILIIKKILLDSYFNIHVVANYLSFLELLKKFYLHMLDGSACRHGTAWLQWPTTHHPQADKPCFLW